MAEAFFKKYCPDGYESKSAGTKPGAQVNPTVIQVMKEVGIDLSNNKTKKICKRVTTEEDYKWKGFQIANVQKLANCFKTGHYIGDTFP